MTEEDLNQLIILSFRLSNLMDVGTPILRALDSCVEAMATERMREALSHVRERASMGSSLTDAFGEHPEVFNAFFVDMVRTGEDRGTLDQALMKLSHALEREKALLERHRATVEQELPHLALDTLSVLKQRGVDGLRILNDPGGSTLSVRPACLEEVPELERWMRDVEGFRRGIMDLMGLGDWETLAGRRAGKVLGAPPFFVRIVSLPRLAGVELEVTLHDYPERPPEGDRVDLAAEVEKSLWDVLERHGAGVLLSAQDAFSRRLAMAWILTRLTQDHARRCAWISDSHWPPVFGITAVPAEALVSETAEETWESLQAFGYDTVGLSLSKGVLMEEVIHLRERPFGLLLGRIGCSAAGHDSTLGEHWDWLSLFVREQGDRLILTSS